jgi:ketosteroid isomerase-like protein
VRARGAAVLVAAVLCAGLAPALRAAAPEGSPEKVLLELEAKRRDAIRKGDVDTLKKIYAEDFQGVVGNGSVIDRAELLSIFASTDPKASFDTDELSIRVYETTAVVTGRLTGSAAGATTSQSRYVHVYVKRPAGWQCVYGQSTQIK